MTITPDDKDWTWVIERRCAECGFDPSTVTRDNLTERMTAALQPWADVLERSDAAERPDEQTWSPLEYAAHVRDVCTVMAQRLALICSQDNPEFPNWDQDQAAVDGDYASTHPDVLNGELAREGKALISAYDGVDEDQWDRTGLRGNGAHFTAYTLGVYALHDLEHHAHDVERT